MNDIDDRLIGYAERWRVAQPEPPTVDWQRLSSTHWRWRPQLWIPLAAAAAVLALVGAGIAFVNHEAGPPGPVQPGSPVPWRSLEPRHPVIPTLDFPPEPDPAQAATLPACHTSDTDTDPRASAITLLITSAVRCQLSGTATVVPLDPDGPWSRPRLSIPPPTAAGKVRFRSEQTRSGSA